MRLVVLTTATTHHAWFLRELNAAFPVEATLVETEAVRPPFEVHHPFEDERDLLEREAWFGGGQPALADLTPVVSFGSLNDGGAAEALADLRPDVTVVFGTGRLGPELIDACPGDLINLHGGDPERYRGLDSHLWAIYHGDFGGLVTTLHRVNPRLDDGDVILKADVPVRRGMALAELRRANTEVCLDLVLSALDVYARRGGFISLRQARPGRYYSFMPAALKDLCVRRFARYTAAL